MRICLYLLFYVHKSRYGDAHTALTLTKKSPHQMHDASMHKSHTLMTESMVSLKVYD